MKRSPNRMLAGLVAFASLSACSPRTVVVKAVASAVTAESGTSNNFSGDKDPELVRAAVPFGLKTMEGLLEEQPEHEGLLISLAGGFTQYAYAFVQADAEQADRSRRVRSAIERAGFFCELGTTGCAGSPCAMRGWRIGCGL